MRLRRRASLIRKRVFDVIVLRPPKSKADWAVLACGAALVYFSGLASVMGTLSLGWPKAEGKIVYSSPHQEFRLYRVELRYRFVYNGREYEGDRYRFQFAIARDRMESWQVDTIQARYRVGEPVQVAVNPWNPADSVLESGPDVEAFLWVGFGLLLMLAGVGERKTVPPNETGIGTLAPGPLPGPRFGTAKVLLAIGGGIFLWGLATIHTGWRSLSWPTTGGKILYSEARAGQSYRTQMWYEYFVENKRYLGSNYRVGGNSTPFQNVAVAAARRYPAGQAVTVHYNPSDAAEAVLEPGVWYGNLVQAGIGLALLGAAWMAKLYAVAVSGLTSRRSPESRRA